MRRPRRFGPFPPDRAALFASPGRPLSLCAAAAMGTAEVIDALGRQSDRAALAVALAALLLAEMGAASAPRPDAGSTTPAETSGTRSSTIANSGTPAPGGGPAATTTASVADTSAAGVVPPEPPSSAPSPALPPVTLIYGDALDVLPTMDAESIDACITDPPHGVLTRQPWDVLPTTDFWRAVHRVLVPGAPLVAVGAPRTFHAMATAIAGAGFVIDDMMAWLFTRGRPPSERRLKRAMAPIVVARKAGPLRRLNIDEARLPFIDEADRASTKRIDSLRALGSRRGGVYAADLSDNPKERAAFRPKAGRWPANVIETEPLLGAADRFFLLSQHRDPGAHPAAKPVAVMSHLIKLFVPAGGLVLDPFAGGGSTGVAAAAVGRRAVLIERERRFVALAECNLAAAGVPVVASERFQPHSAGLANAAIMSDFECLTHSHERATGVGGVQPDREPLDPDSPSRPDAPPAIVAPAAPPPAAPSTPTLVDHHAMAARIGVSPRAMLAHARAGRVPHVRVSPRRLLFDPDAVVAALTRGGDAADASATTILTTSYTKEHNTNVDPSRTPRSLRGSGLQGGSVERETVAPVQTRRGDRTGAEAGAAVRDGGRLLGGAAPVDAGSDVAGTAARRALEPERRTRLRHLLGIDLPAVGASPPRHAHEGSPGGDDADPR